MHTSRVTRFLAAGSVAVALGAAALPAASASAATKTTKMAFFEKEASFKQTATAVEFTSLLYVGDAKHHAVHWTATDHYLCTFAADGPPSCDGEIAIGNSMLLIKGTGGQGTFSIPVVGGTGHYAGAKGSEAVHDLAGSPNANLIVTLTRR